MLTFSECESKRMRNGRAKLENNTYLHRLDADTFGVRLHATDVVKIHRDGSYTLETGGWRTVTTKDRINEYAPVTVFSEKGIWLVRKHRNWQGPSGLFVEGLRVMADGSFDPPLEDPKAANADKRRLDKKVRQYIDGFAKAMVAEVRENGHLPQPNGGDCWGCCMRPVEDRTREGMGHDHYLSHFQEEYYVPSLLWNALQDCGNPAVVWTMIEMDCKRGDSRTLKDRLQSFFRRMKPALLKELQHQLA